jgi:hypothetical protein
MAVLMSALPSKKGSTRGCCFASFFLRTAETDERKLWASEAAQIHIAPGRRGRVAGRGARAAAGDAGGRVS